MGELAENGEAWPNQSPGLYLACLGVNLEEYTQVQRKALCLRTSVELKLSFKQVPVFEAKTPPTLPGKESSSISEVNKRCLKSLAFPTEKVTKP